MSSYLLCFVLLSCNYQASGFWWLFSRSQETPTTEKATMAVDSTSIQNVFAPFEVSNIEEKFLTEASHYLGNLPKLDQCNLLIVNRLQHSCNKMSDEDLSKLSVNLLNCQSLTEGRKIYKCTDEMTLAQCTEKMDSDTWNAYHIVSNRARSVCYNLRQSEFRMKTEITVNKLASSALQNLDVLQNLLNGQDKLKEATSETTAMIKEGQKDILTNNLKLKQEQVALQDIIERNIEQLGSEKVLMTSRQRQIENFSRLVNKQLGSLLEEFHHQGTLKKKGDREILQNLEAVKGRSQQVLEKLESTLDNMNSKYVTIEQKHTETMKNMEEIQRTITFMNDVMQKLETTINSQISWLNYFVGGTEDKLTVISLLLGHSLYFFVAVLAVLFIGAPWITKLIILVIFPLNALMAIKGSKYFKYEELSIIVIATYPVHWVTCAICRLFGATSNKCYSSGIWKMLSKSDTENYTLSLPGPNVKKDQDEIEWNDNNPNLGLVSGLLPSRTESVHQAVAKMLPHLMHSSTDGSQSAPATPRGRRHLVWSSTPKKSAMNESSSSLPGTPSSESKARPRCSSFTAKGNTCRNLALPNLDVCRVHASKSSNDTFY